MAEDYEKGQVMKICTITCHDVYNVGASLQAYALQTYLKSLGHDVKIIDYKPDYLSKDYRLDIVRNPKYDKPLLKQAYLLATLPGRLRVLPRKKAFDSFTAKYLDLTRRYVSNEELKADPPEADRDASKTLSSAEAASLAVAMSLDGLAVGFGAGMGNASPVLVLLFSLLLTAAAVMGGSALGNRVAARLRHDLSWVGGALLLLLAAIKLL